MALLYRYTRLNDRANTGVFTFIVTRSVTRDIHRDATTKDFVFGYHRWAISFCRQDKNVLGVVLILRNPSAGTRVLVDFTFTLVSREHFSKNELFSQRQCAFTLAQSTHGTPRLIATSDLRAKRFSDENSEFVLELTLGNIKAIYESDFKPTSSSPAANPKAPVPSPKLETPSFMFGGLEWNVTMVQNGSPPPSTSATSANAETPETGRCRVFLNRLTGFQHHCRVQYRVVVQEGERKADSGMLDQISDLNGRIRGFPVKGFPTLDPPPKVHVELLCANLTSEVKVALQTRDPNAEPNCYDRDRQGWSVEADADAADCLKVKVFFSDIQLVPRNHLRYVSWNVYVVRTQANSGNRESVPVLDAPHSNFYVQDGVDMGVVMDTNIPVKDVSTALYLLDLCYNSI
ncbi:hypothetical protein LAZ67_19000365 [Cordylochernes scorpioides]|uniref:MATH domain-containing protein n=1 Tax=Cordylochernes scorpioides TaxID=51811 RepID=A0ABY6LKV5_9ARAC|nr:hypothetical protein LAZ67_19000365 [Cordylochernes scorpioides]